MVGVPKKAQKGPVKHRNITFLFIARLKMLGFLQNLKWNFSFYATSFLQSFVATFEQLHVEIMLQKTKFGQKKKTIFEYSYMKTLFQGPWIQFFFWKWLVMHLERSQKKFQQIFPKNGRVITVQNDLVNEKKHNFVTSRL